MHDILSSGEWRMVDNLMVLNGIEIKTHNCRFLNADKIISSSLLNLK